MLASKFLLECNGATHTIRSAKPQGQTCKIARLGALEAAGHDLARLPYSLRALLENLLRHEDGVSVTKEDIEEIDSLFFDAKASAKLLIEQQASYLQ